MNENQKEIILLKDLGMIYPMDTSKHKRRYGIFKCYCGKEFRARTSDIKCGHLKSCGCYQIKRAKETKTTHGLYNHRLYNIWYMMKNRCFDKKHMYYGNYGGRGITVCDRWLNFENFILDMYPTYKEGLKLDRINNDGNYEPNNCRWVTQSIQTRNTQKLSKDNTSGYRGVCWHKVKKRWMSSIGVNSKIVYLGYFDCRLAAAYAYDDYVIKNNLEHTRNF